MSDYEEEYIEDVKNLIAFYFITQYNYIKRSIVDTEGEPEGELKQLIDHLLKNH